MTCHLLLGKYERADMVPLEHGCATLTKVGPVVTPGVTDSEPLSCLYAGVNRGKADRTGETNAHVRIRTRRLRVKPSCQPGVRS